MQPTEVLTLTRKNTLKSPQMCRDWEKGSRAEEGPMAENKAR